MADEKAHTLPMFGDEQPEVTETPVSPPPRLQKNASRC